MTPKTNSRWDRPVKCDGLHDENSYIEVNVFIDTIQHIHIKLFSNLYVNLN